MPSTGMKKSELSHLATRGAEIMVRVTPKASRNKIVLRDGVICIYVTTVPEDGKATAEVQKMLAKALGVAKMDLVLVRGATSRDKVFVIR